MKISDKDDIRILEQKVKKYRGIDFKTEEDYIKYKNNILDYEDLDFISSRYYGSHEYNDFILRYMDDISKLSFEEKFKLFKGLYTSAKNTKLIGDLIQTLVEDKEIPEYEYKLIKENFTPIVYRGFNGLNLPDGCSFTTDIEKAKWFSNRFRCFGKEGYVIKININIDDVIFYYNGRDENEVFIRRKSLKNINREIIEEV